MTIDKFLPCKNTGQDLILSSAPPYIFGRAVFYPSVEQMMYELGLIKPFLHAKIPRYTIALTWAGTISGNKIPLNKATTEKLQTILNNMAAWYRSEIIDKNEKDYAEYKI
jgi:hypothetical protein